MNKSLRDCLSAEDRRRVLERRRSERYVADRHHAARELSAAKRLLRKAKREYLALLKNLEDLQAWERNRRAKHLARRRMESQVPVSGGGKDYPSISAAATAKGVSPTTIRTWIDAGIWRRM